MGPPVPRVTNPLVVGLIPILPTGTMMLTFPADGSVLLRAIFKKIKAKIRHSILLNHRLPGSSQIL